MRPFLDLLSHRGSSRSRSSSTKPRRTANHRPLRAEPLEQRRLLAVATGGEALAVEATNTAPTLWIRGAQTVANGDTLSIPDMGLFSDPDTGHENFTVNIDWGDGEVASPFSVQPVIDGGEGELTWGTFDGTHTFTTVGSYQVSVSVTDDQGGQSAEHNLTVEVTDSLPQDLALATVTAIDEGGSAAVSGSFTNTDSTKSHTVTISWGDGSDDTVIDLEPEVKSFALDHPYPDDGPNPGGTNPPSGEYTYPISVTVTDSNNNSIGMQTTVTVSNVAPELTPIFSYEMVEGSEFSDELADYSDASILDTHTATIDWGDGTTTAGVIDTEAGTISGTHTYPDENRNEKDVEIPYTVTVTLTDDDTGTSTETFSMRITNADPVLDEIPGQNEGIFEGDLVSFGPISFTDAGTLDTHTATVDWGDGTEAVPATVNQNASTVSGSHTFADNGTYTVEVIVTDNAGATSVPQTFQVVVQNADPALTAASDRTTTSGVSLDITNIGVFTDPGFDNTGLTTESFGFEIDWGDKTDVDSGVPTIDVSGSAGVLTQGSFDGSHSYATAGEYTVTVKVTDDDGGQATDTLTVTVTDAAPASAQASIGPLTETEYLVRSSRVLLAAPSSASSEPETAGPLTETEYLARTLSIQSVTLAAAESENAPPILGTVGDRTLDEGQLNIVSMGAFLDYDSQGPFSYSIDWGDGAAAEMGTATITTSGPPTAGTFNGNRFMDDGLYTVAITLSDEHANSVTETVYFTIQNVAPTADPGGPYEVEENGAVQLYGDAYDPAEHLDPLTFEWDLDDDGNYGETGEDATRGQENVQNPIFSATGLSGPQSWPVRLRVLDDEGDARDPVTTSVLIQNVAPTIHNLQIVTPVDEGDKSTLSGNLIDPSDGDVLSLEIDWGDGSPVDTYSDLAPGSSFSYEHLYEDDGLTPGGSPSHDYEVSIVASDNAGGSTPYSLDVQVDNISPLNVTLEDLERVDEHEQVTLRGTFAEPGVLDTHQVTVKWGDGAEETIDLTLGDLEFTATHRYLDDGPTPGGTNPPSASFDYQIEVTVEDDDTGTGTAIAKATVDNVAPILRSVETIAIDENDITTLSGEVFDPGTLDTFTLQINWNDQSDPQSIPLGTDPIDAEGITWNPDTREFAVNHQYLDDGLTPGGSPVFDYSINLTITDDDTGTNSSSETVRVTNIDPTVAITGAPTEPPLEATAVSLSASVSDPGTLDTFTYAWSVTKGGLPYDDGTGNRTDQPGFTFLPGDDGTYRVTLRVTDDDTGSNSASVDIAVENAPPVAEDDHYQFDGVGILEIEASGILGNDHDPGLDYPLRAVDFSDLVCTGSGADCGTLTANEDGSFTYEPVEDFSGTVAFTYRAMDQDGAVSETPATVTIDVGMNSTIAGYVYAKNQDSRFVPSQLPLPGVFITLEAIDEAGIVRMNALTNDDGYYEFTSLRAGTYRVTERQPAAVLDGGQHEQTVTIHVNEDSTNNNFSETWLRPQQVSIGNFLASNLNSQSGDDFWTGDLRERMAQAEEDAGNDYEAAVIRYGDMIHAAQRGSLLSLTGTELSERFIIESDTTSQKATIWWNGFERTYEAAVDEVFTVTIHGGGGSDEAELYDSTRSDLLEGRYNLARMINDRFLVDLIDFDRIRAISQAGGNDRTSMATTVDYLLTLEGPWNDAP